MRRLFVIAMLCVVTGYTPPQTPRYPLIVDECAPGYTINAPDYNPPCVPIPLGRWRGQG